MWTKAYGKQAEREGWSLFTCDDGVIRIQRIDDPTILDSWQEGDSVKPRFKNDKTAIRFVERLANKGVRYAVLATQLHEQYDYKVIVDTNKSIAERMAYIDPDCKWDKSAFTHQEALDILSWLETHTTRIEFSDVEDMDGGSRDGTPYAVMIQRILKGTF